MPGSKRPGLSSGFPPRDDNLSRFPGCRPAAVPFFRQGPAVDPLSGVVARRHGLDPWKRQHIRRCSLDYISASTPSADLSRYFLLGAVIVSRLAALRCSARPRPLIRLQGRGSLLPVPSCASRRWFAVAGPSKGLKPSSLGGDGGGIAPRFRPRIAPVPTAMSRR